ncbi:hypothetical protein [Acinetobacter pragensis]|uniref:hypothetical protein n=1 Tax=Acinetobacter pragensis TaxID=1806892 RepID=UPI003341BA23
MSGTKVWGRIVGTLRVLAALFAGAVGIGIWLQSEGEIEFSPLMEKVAWGVGLTVIAVDNVGTLIARDRQARRRELYAYVDELLMQLLVQISMSKRAHVEELGVSIWLKKRWQPVRFWRTDEVAFWRMRRFRPMNYPHQSNVSWTSRMGAVGDCWTTERRCYRNLYRLSVGYDEDTLQRMTAEQFEALSSESQAGFTHREFQVTAGKYSEIIATPIFSAAKKPKMIGVLSVDRGMPELGAGEEFAAALNDPTTHGHVQVIVELIGRRLDKADD